MRRYAAGIFSLVVVVLFTLLVVSIFFNERYKTLQIEYPTSKNILSKRLRETRFSFPLSHLAGYNYFWLNAVRNHNEGARGYTNVDSVFYADNGLTHASFGVVFSGLLNPDMSFDEGRLKELVTYFKQARVGKKNAPLQFSDARWAHDHMPATLSQWSVNYADASNSERVQKAVASQLAISMAVLNHEPASEDEDKNYVNCIIEPGSVSAAVVARRRGGARDYGLRTAARNILAGWRTFERARGGTNIRILFRNSASDELADLSGSLLLGEDPADLRTLRSYMLRFNRASGRPIKNLSARLGYAIDSGKIVAQWYSPNKALFKDTNSAPINHTGLIEALQKSLLSRNENPIYVVFASFNTLPDDLINDRELRNNQSLPFTRGEAPASVDRQLRLLKELYAMSAATHVVFDMPRRELFPIVHRVLKPFLGPDKTPHMYYKANGAERWEQEYSVELVRNYLAANVR